MSLIPSIHHIGCRLQKFWLTWAHMGGNEKVVSILKESCVLPFRIRSPLTRNPLIISRYANPLRNSYMEESLHSMIQKQAIEIVWVSSALVFLNRWFLVPKHKWRPILDWSTLNHFLAVKTFKMGNGGLCWNSVMPICVILHGAIAYQFPHLNQINAQGCAAS